MARDIHSFARPEVARVTDVALDLDVDFERRQIGGSATLTLDVAPGAGEVVLDTRKLAISAVRTPAGEALPFRLGDADPILGRPLTVQLPRGDRQIVVVYRTAPDADARLRADGTLDAWLWSNTRSMPSCADDATRRPSCVKMSARPYVRPCPA